MLRATQFIVGLLLLVALEISRAYFSSSFPAGQQSQTGETASFLQHNILWLRIIGVLIIAFPVIYYFTFGTKLSRWVVAGALLAYIFIFYKFNV